MGKEDLFISTVKCGNCHIGEECLKKYLKAYTFLLPISIVLIVLDQWTKSMVRTNLAPSEFWMPVEWLAPYLRIVNWHNTGAAFGIFQGMNSIFVVLAFVIIALILVYFPLIPVEDIYFRLALTLQLSGATGNLIDRLYRGFVTDFISVGRFPVFNVADSCITMGVVVLLIGMWVEERRTRYESRTEDEPRTDPHIEPL
jgi:signal peptidase II